MIFPTQNKEVFKLMIGTAIAQAIPFIFSPLLSRLYLPEEYALLGIMLATSNIFFEMVTLKYDKTIVLEEDKASSMNLFFMSFFFSVLLGVFFAFLLFLFKPYILSLNIHPSVDILMYIVPVIVFFMSFVVLSNYWFQRIQEYYRMTTNKIVQMVFITGFSILFGYLNVKNGLTIGYLFGWLVVFLFSIYQLKKTSIHFNFFNMNRCVELFKKYKSYPKYNLLPSLLNVIAIALPFYLVTYIYGDEYGGHFNMMKQLLMIPASFVSLAFTQVYYRKFAEAVNLKNKITPLLISMLKPLFIFGITFLLMVFFFGDVLFTSFLGSNWEMSGKIAMVYVVGVFFQFMGLTLMVILPAINKIKQESFFKFIYFISICILFLIKFNNQQEFIMVYTIIESVLYGLLSIYCIYVVKRFDKYTYA